MKFNSQICTSREQSERLLALGLKKETADMAIEPDLESTYEVYYISAYPPSKRGVPAWSLHRLWELADLKSVDLEHRGEISQLYDHIIIKIGIMIEREEIDQEYLEE